MGNESNEILIFLPQCSLTNNRNVCVPQTHDDRTVRFDQEELVDKAQTKNETQAG